LTAADKEAGPVSRAQTAGRLGSLGHAAAFPRLFLSRVAVSLSVVSTTAYFLASNGVRNYLRWVVHAMRFLITR